VEKAKDWSGMTGFRSCDTDDGNLYCVGESSGSVIEAGCLRTWEDRSNTVIEFGVNDGGGNGRGCVGIEIRTDTAELAKMIIA